jgi:hypothetical protein
MSSGEQVFGKLKEVEIILPASTIPTADIYRFVMGQEELLPSVEVQGMTVTVIVERHSEERGLLDLLHQI